MILIIETCSCWRVSKLSFATSCSCLSSKSCRIFFSAASLCVPSFTFHSAMGLSFSSNCTALCFIVCYYCTLKLTRTQLSLTNRTIHLCNMQWNGWCPSLKTHSSLHGLPCRTSSLLVKRYERTYGEPRKKLVPSYHGIWHLNDTSMSFNVIATAMDRSDSYNFLLVIHSNHGPILYRFQDIPVARYWLKTAIFVGSCIELRGIPLELCNAGWAQKLQWWGYHAEKKAWWYLLPFRYNTRAWQTDFHRR